MEYQIWNHTNHLIYLQRLAGLFLSRLLGIPGSYEEEGSPTSVSGHELSAGWEMSLLTPGSLVHGIPSAAS